MDVETALFFLGWMEEAVSFLSLSSSTSPSRRRHRPLHPPLMPTPASSTYSLPASKDSGSVDTDADADAEPSAAPAVPDTGDHGEGGKLKMIVQLVRRALGVKDIAAM